MKSCFKLTKLWLFTFWFSCAKTFILSALRRFKYCCRFVIMSSSQCWSGKCLRLHSWNALEETSRSHCRTFCALWIEVSSCEHFLVVALHKIRKVSLSCESKIVTNQLSRPQIHFPPWTIIKKGSLELPEQLKTKTKFEINCVKCWAMFCVSGVSLTSLTGSCWFEAFDITDLLLSASMDSRGGHWLTL